MSKEQLNELGGAGSISDLAAARAKNIASNAWTKAKSKLTPDFMKGAKAGLEGQKTANDLANQFRTEFSRFAGESGQNKNDSSTVQQFLASRLGFPMHVAQQLVAKGLEGDQSRYKASPNPASMPRVQPTVSAPQAPQGQPQGQQQAAKTTGKQTPPKVPSGTQGPGGATTNNTAYQNQAIKTIRDQIRGPVTNKNVVLNTASELIKHARDWGGPEKDRVIAALKAIRKDPEAIKKVPELARMTLENRQRVIDFALFLVEKEVRSKTALNECYQRFYKLNEDVISYQALDTIFKNAAQLYLASHARMNPTVQRDNDPGNKPAQPYSNPPAHHGNDLGQMKDQMNSQLQNMGVDTNKVRSLLATAKQAKSPQDVFAELSKPENADLAKKLAASFLMSYK